mmetsp:Transcript_15519/g.48568  ORF Transcript_15519/g.48568 Transcript_15519/m.48568 type:complete len:213 (-) Transcript_15519:198-836(-)
MSPPGGLPKGEKAADAAGAAAGGVGSSPNGLCEAGAGAAAAGGALNGSKPPEPKKSLFAAGAAAAGAGSSKSRRLTGAAGVAADADDDDDLPALRDPLEALEPLGGFMAGVGTASSDELASDDSSDDDSTFFFLDFFLESLAALSEYQRRSTYLALMKSLRRSGFASGGNGGSGCVHLARKRAFAATLPPLSNLVISSSLNLVMEMPLTEWV